MARLVVRLLGGFHVVLDEEAVYDFETDKARALLAYLMVEAGRPHRREALAGLLWPDRPDTIARTNLRQALSRVRRALRDQGSPPFLLVTSSDIQFNTASDYALDVAELEAFARRDPRCAPPSLLPEALCADFLAGFASPDSEAFEAWVLNRQERYQRLALEILEAQAAYFEGTGEYGQAAAAARRQLQLEPWLEEAHRRCMADLALAGRREEALQQYETCRRVLQREFGLEPSAGTQALHDEIRSGNLAAHANIDLSGFRKPDRSGASDRPGAPVVARGAELGELARHLERALAGETGVVFVSGDAGSGKTVLLEAFAERALARYPDLLVAGARCNPGGSLDAFAPLRRLAEMLFGDLANHAAWQLRGPEQMDRLQAATAAARVALAEHGPDLEGTLISATSIARRSGRRLANASAALAPPRRPLSQGALFDQLLAALAALAETQPLLLLLDDLHWVDDATAAFLLHFARDLSDSPILLAGAYRSSHVALGRQDPHLGKTVRHPLAEAINELRRLKGEVLVDLDRADGRAFVDDYVNMEPNRLGADFRDALYARTGGHALFTVETLLNLQDHGELYRDEAGRWAAARSLDWGALPARVGATIAERIDRLPEEERCILSAASVQGDDFEAEIAAELAGLPVSVVLAHLSGSLARQHHLVKPEGLKRAPVGQQVRSLYRFTHHLFQKYLHDQLDPVERAQLHGRVAACLALQAADNQPERERLAEQLAWHYEHARMPVEAARALLDAGNQAMRLAAFREALARYDHGLALIATAPPSAAARAAERLLEVARLDPERVLEGLTGAGTLDALTRATKACAVPADESSAWPKLRVQMAETEYLLGAGEFEKALAAAERLGEDAAESAAELFVGLAQFYIGAIRHAQGDSREAERRLKWVLDWLTPGRRTELRAATGLDLLANGLAISALSAWHLGYPETALARSREAIAAARAGGAAVVSTSE